MTMETRSLVSGRYNLRPLQSRASTKGSSWELHRRDDEQRSQQQRLNRIYDSENLIPVVSTIHKKYEHQIVNEGDNNINHCTKRKRVAVSLDGTSIGSSSPRAPLQQVVGQRQSKRLKTSSSDVNIVTVITSRRQPKPSAPSLKKNKTTKSRYFMKTVATHRDSTTAGVKQRRTKRRIRANRKTDIFEDSLEVGNAPNKVNYDARSINLTSTRLLLEEKSHATTRVTEPPCLDNFTTLLSSTLHMEDCTFQRSAALLKYDKTPFQQHREHLRRSCHNARPPTREMVLNTVRRKLFV